jgi:hypothetical protein
MAETHMPKRNITRALIAASLVCAFPSVAEVVDSSASGFLTTNSAVIAAAPDKVYAALIQVGHWWDPEHTYSGDARNLTMEAKPGGCFCERIPGQGGIQHATVVYVASGKILRLNGALGPLQEFGVVGSLTWSLTKAGSGTQVTMNYSAGGYYRGGFQSVAPLVDSVLATQLRRLKEYIERPAVNR